MSKIRKQLEKFGLSDSQIEEIIGIGKAISVRKNEVIIHYNEPCNKVYYLVKGAFISRFINEEKEMQKAINFFFEDSHSFITIPDAFFSTKLSNSELRAVKPSEVLEFKLEDIQYLIAKDPDIYNFYHNQVIKGLLEENALKTKIITETKENLYNYLVNKYPSLLKYVSTKHIAEFMGITPEWLSKIKKNQQ
jgi:CRP-like cAMP-binding protein